MKDQNPNLDYYSLPLRPDQTVTPINLTQQGTDPAADAAQQPTQPQANAAAEPLNEEQRAAIARQEKSARRAYSRVGLAISAMIVVWLALTFATQMALAIVDPALLQDPVLLLVASNVPLILVAEPIAYLIMRSLPTRTPEVKAPIGGAKLTLLLFMSMGIMIVGSLISNIAMSIFTAVSGIELANSLDIILDAPIWAITLFAVILAPIFEELVCRKWILTRLLPYGELPAILISSALFGIMHGNLFQFLYAFGVGVLFSLVYLRTGRLRYCITLHVLVNALGSLVTTVFLSQMDPELARIMLEGVTEIDPEVYMTLIFENFVPLMLQGLYTMTQYAMALAGVILLILAAKRIKLIKREGDLPLGRAVSLAVGSVGGVLLLIVALIFLVINMGTF